MQKLNKQPVIILGGFFINVKSYQLMANWLSTKENIETKIIKINRLEWLLTNWKIGWIRILDKVNESVLEYKKISPTGKVTLIGHSSGGVMLRVYLSEDKFGNRIYNGKQYCNNLITLGSPHQAKRSTPLRAMVDKKYPGAYFFETVNYISVGGKLDLNSKCASKLSKRISKKSYKSITDSSLEEGDGLVPLSSSLLEGSHKIIINHTSHSQIFGDKWYGSTIKINEWWTEINKVR